MKNCLELTSSLLNELVYNLKNEKIVICYYQAYRVLKDGTLEEVTDQTKYIPQVYEKLKEIGLTIDDVDFLNEHYLNLFRCITIKKNILSLNGGGEIAVTLRIYPAMCATVDLELFNEKHLKTEQFSMPAKLSSVSVLDIEQFFLDLGKKFFGEGKFYIDEF